MSRKVQVCKNSKTSIGSQGKETLQKINWKAFWLQLQTNWSICQFWIYSISYYINKTFGVFSKITTNKYKILKILLSY